MNRAASTSPPGTRPAGAARDWGIGELAIYNKLLTREQLEECQRIREGMAGVGFHIPIGQVLIEKYYLDAATVRALIRARTEIAGPGFDPATERVNIVKLTPGEHETIVARIAERKLVTAEKIDECLTIQQRLGEYGIDKDLGEVLLEMGYVDRSVVEDILRPHTRTRARIQREGLPDDAPVAIPPEATTTRLTTSGAVFRRGEAFQLPENKRLLFGRIAAEKGLVTAEQVEECLFVQFKLKELGIIKRLGEVLVEKKLAQPSDVKRILAIQKHLHGKVKWIDKNLTVSQKKDDVLLQRLLLKNEILGPEEVNECLYVQHMMRKLGIEKNLAAVIVDKEYLEAEVVRGILREAKRAQARAAEEARASEQDAAARTTPDGFVFADVELKKAYLDILQSHQPPDLAGTVDRRAAPIRTTAALRVLPLGRIAAGLVLLLVAAGGYVARREAARPSPTPAGSPPPAVRPIGGSGVDTGRSVPAPPTAGPTDAGPSVEAPWVVELRRAAAGLPFPAEGGPAHEARASLAIVAAGPVEAPSLPGARFFAFRAHFWLPAGAKVQAELFYRGETPAGSARLVAVGARGEVEGWFGPYADRPPADLFAEFTNPWALCGPYAVRFTFHLESQEPSTRDACAGLPYLDESGTATVDRVFHYPDRAGFEAASAEQDRLLSARLAQLLAHIEAGRRELGERAARAEGQSEGPARDACRQAAADLDRAIGQVRTALQNLQDNLLTIPRPQLFRLLDDLLAESTRMLDVAAGEPATTAFERFDRLAGSLRAHLGS